MEDNIFDIITNYSVNEGINKISLEDEEYRKIQKEIDEKIKRYKQLGLTKEQRLEVDRLISAHTASGACYGRITYRKGFHDCVSLLQEMGLIRAAWDDLIMQSVWGQWKSAPIQSSSQPEDSSSLILPSEETQSLAETTDTETIDAREDEPQTLEVYQPETTVNSIPLKYYQALNRANAFSNTMHMSKADIYDQIISAYGDNFSADAAQYAVDHLTNVWEPEEQEPVPTAQDSAEMVSNDMQEQVVTVFDDEKNGQSEEALPESEISTPVGMVWLSETGEKYHCVNDCGRMNPRATLEKYRIVINLLYFTEGICII